MKICHQCKTSFQTRYCLQCNCHPGMNGSTEYTKFFNKEAFTPLYQLEDNHFWFRARNQLILWVLAKFFPRAKCFLEIGCGTGYVISAIQKAFPALSVVAADIFQESLPFVRERMGNIPHILQ